MASAEDSGRPRYAPSHLAGRILDSRSALEGERKTVTALFCDIVDSTGTAERVGAEAMSQLIEAFLARSLAEVHRYDGIVTQFLGDGFLALFGAPLAQEDHARRAVLAAWGIVTSLGADPLRVPNDDRAVAVRIGLNSGDVVVGRIGDSLRMDYTAIGDTINLAARLQAAAEPGRVFLGESTAVAAEGWIDTELVGARRVKGRAEPVVVHRLVGVRGAGGTAGSGRGARAALIGRERELAAFDAAVGSARDGHGHLLLVTGEAGVGKSRLITEGRSQSGAGLRWLEGRTLSFGQGISYWPFLEALRGLCGITDEDGQREGMEKLEAEARRVFGEGWADVLPYLATLLGLEVDGHLGERIRYLDGGAMKAQILRCVRRLFQELARQGPVALLIEDIHWIDESSIELIEHLLPLVNEVPLLIVCASRAGAEPLERLRGSARRDDIGATSEIALAPLSSEDSACLLADLTGSRRLAPAEAARLTERAQGNPFFLEEIARWHAVHGDDGAALPATVEGVILARVDRLDEDVKDVLKVASVVGRTFLRRVLAAVAAADLGLDAAIERLLDTELVQEHRAVPELEYRFSHVLVQEATYGSILRQRRSELHRRVGESIERLFAGRLEGFYGLLAHHYGQAGDLMKAREYLLKAADEAGRIAADTEALGFYLRALETHAQVFGDRWDPVERAALERGVGEVYFRLGRHQDAVENLHAALDLLGERYPADPQGVSRAFTRELVLRTFGKPVRRLRRERQATPADQERFAALQSLSWIDYLRDPPAFALDALLLLNHSERRSLPSGVALGSAGLGIVYSTIPLGRAARAQRGRSLALVPDLADGVLAGDVLFCAGLGELLQGDWDEALGHWTGAAARFREAGALRRWGTSETLRAYIFGLQGRFDECLEVCDEIEVVADDASEGLLLGYAHHTRGVCLLRRGDAETGLPLCRSAVELYRAVPDLHTLLRAVTDVGLCNLGLGRLEEAAAAVGEGEEIVQRYGFRGFQPAAVAVSRADVHLALAEGGSGASLADARTAVRTAMKRSRPASEARPGACRVRGNLAWLEGSRRAARRSWDQGLVHAEALGAPYEAALVELDAGRRMGDPDRLGRAEALFSRLGAPRQVALVRQALESVG